MDNRVVSTRSLTVTRVLYRLSALFAFLAVLGGAIVCATESGFECGNWPGCNTDALLPTEGITAALYKNPWIEMAHRSSAILTGPFVLAAAISALFTPRLSKLAKAMPWVALAGAFVAGFVGRMIVLGIPFPFWVGVADLAFALVALTAMIVGTVASERTPSGWRPTLTGRLAWLGVGLTFAMHLVSLYAAGPGSYTRCMSWPVWGVVHADTTGNLTMQIIRVALAIAAVTVLLAAAWRGVNVRGLKGAAWVLAISIAFAIGFGIVIAVSGTDALGAPFSVATVVLFASGLLLAARASVFERQPNTEDGISEEDPRVHTRV